MKIKKFSKKISLNEDFLNNSLNKKVAINNNYLNNYQKNKFKNIFLNNKNPTLTISSNNTFQNKKFMMSKSIGNISKIRPKNINTQKNNPYMNFNKNNYKTNINANSILSKINTNKKYHNTISNTKNNISIRNKLYPKKNKNFINFVDRNKIRNIGLISLKLFDDYLQENNISLRNNQKKKLYLLKKRNYFI